MPSLKVDAAVVVFWLCSLLVITCHLCSATAPRQRSSAVSLIDKEEQQITLMMYVEQGECCVIGSGSWTITHSCLHHIWPVCACSCAWLCVWVCLFECVSVCMCVFSDSLLMIVLIRAARSELIGSLGLSISEIK